METTPGFPFLSKRPWFTELLRAELFLKPHFSLILYLSCWCTDILLFRRVQIKAKGNNLPFESTLVHKAVVRLGPIL